MVEAFGSRSILKEKPVGKKIGSPEVEKKIFQFKPEVKTILKEKLKLQVHNLTGKSILELEKSRNFQSTWLDSFTDFKQKRSNVTEVAINSEIFLPGSDKKTFKDQISMVADYDKKIRGKVEGVKVVMGKTADNIELFYNLTDGVNGNEELLRKGSARSADHSPIPSVYALEKGEAGHCITVGHMNSEKILGVVGYNNPRRPFKDVYVVAMVVPEDLTLEEPAK